MIQENNFLRSSLTRIMFMSEGRNICPSCHGNGTWQASVTEFDDGAIIKCFACSGHGVVSLDLKTEISNTRKFLAELDKSDMAQVLSNEFETKHCDV